MFAQQNFHLQIPIVTLLKKKKKKMLVIFEKIAKTKKNAYARSSQTFPSRGAFLITIFFFHGALLYIIYFGRAAGDLLSQQI